MYENLFFDLIDKDLLFVSLEFGSNVSMKKSSFSFKGKCMTSLLWGQVQINGYSLRVNSNDNLKWFEVYSPETNAFLSIKSANPSRKRKAESNETFDANQDYKKTVVEQLKRLLNIELQNEVESRLVTFLANNQFNLKTSSLIALAPFKSQVCSYLSYFPNFQIAYHSKSSAVFLDSKSSPPRNSTNELATKLAKLGLYSVTNTSSVFNETEEIASAVNDCVFGPQNDTSDTDLSISHNQSPPTLMVCGGKDVGKSSLLRFSINTLLNKYPKVAYIDCDPGQTEFTLGGCISLSFITEPLFGPPHTHINHSDANRHVYFLGHLSPNEVPSLYLDYLRQCLSDFEEFTKSSNRNHKIPLVVNTMGWNQGLGLCLLKETILMFKPTHLIQINHPIEANKNMPLLDRNWLNTANGWPPSHKPSAASFDRSSSSLSTSRNESKTSSGETSSSSSASFEMQVDNQAVVSSDENGYKLYVVKSAVPKFSNDPVNSQQRSKKNFSPRDHRNLGIIAYFSRLQDSNTFVSIHHLRPYRIAWSKTCLHVSHMRIDYSQLFNVFNASLVGLCRCDPKYIKPCRTNPELPSLIDMNNEPSKQPILKCLGFGIIRGINMETREFYVLTPEPLEVLNQVNVMVKGMLNLPLEFFYEQDYQTSCPYMTFSNASASTNKKDLLSNEPAQRKYLVHQSLTSANNKSSQQ